MINISTHQINYASEKVLLSFMEVGLMKAVLFNKVLDVFCI